MLESFEARRGVDLEHFRLGAGLEHVDPRDLEPQDAHSVQRQALVRRRQPHCPSLAKELGNSANAFTELGSMRGIYTQTIECKKAGLRPIYGIEVYVAGNHRLGQMSREERDALRGEVGASGMRDALADAASEQGYMMRESDLSTLNLWALDDVGLRNLFILSSLAWTDGYYYKPRVDLELLQQYSDGVACGTAGASGLVGKLIVAGKRSEAIEKLEALKRIYGERLYLEIRPHRLLDQSKVNRFA